MRSETPRHARNLPRRGALSAAVGQTRLRKRRWEYRRVVCGDQCYDLHVCDADHALSHTMERGAVSQILATTRGAGEIADADRNQPNEPCLRRLVWVHQVGTVERDDQAEPYCPPIQGIPACRTNG